jgi:hypothetical protein
VGVIGGLLMLVVCATRSSVGFGRNSLDAAELKVAISQSPAGRANASPAWPHHGRLKVKNEDTTPRPAHQLVVEAFGLYRRYPLIFPVLAAGVVVPYQVVVLVTTGTGPFARSSLDVRLGLLLTLIEWVLIGPLVSALHVHAVRETCEGRDPRLVPVAKLGLSVLPVVVAASIISGLGIALGFVAFFVPGIFLMLRWYVVAQAAAIERDGWLPALRHSHQLTKTHYGHIFVFSIYLALIVSVPTLLVGLGFEHRSTTVASFAVGVIVQVFALSFGALATALLYFDLRARRELETTQRLASNSATGGDGSSRAGHSLDPRQYSDTDRPNGWYVDPGDPGRMRYWGVGDPPGWGGYTRTPRRTRKSWQMGDPDRS